MVPSPVGNLIKPVFMLLIKVIENIGKIFYEENINIFQLPLIQ